MQISEPKQNLYSFAEGLLIGISAVWAADGMLTDNHKISLYDASDPFEIILLHEYSFKAKGAYAHHTFYLNAERNIIGILSYVEELGSPDTPSWGHTILVSSYRIFGYDSSTGFYEREVLSSWEEIKKTYWTGKRAVRILAIGDYLYIVDGKDLGVFSLVTLEEVARITQLAE
ncbi:MAG: beta-propeller domain-containing protein [Coriobacteriia bacterium]|nr:beta-propeller domain-containing protein [Coriobacteriia bacterium]MCL2750421.1 beta-propeller domain-containing protein [Coriobacteriia bacterium]